MKSDHFEIIEGKKTVLLSAPHAFLHKRPKLSGAYRQGERFTDDIVREICSVTGAWGIVLSADIDYDPNYQVMERNEYKKAVQKLCKENNVNQFIDIHGMADGSDFDLGIFYPSRFTKSKSFADIVRQDIAKGELYGVSSALFKFRDDDEETLGEFVAGKMKIPAIQIEISRYIREDAGLRKSFIKNLSDIINKRFV
jgi:hypothetical protein